MREIFTYAGGAQQLDLEKVVAVEYTGERTIARVLMCNNTIRLIEGDEDIAAFRSQLENPVRYAYPGAKIVSEASAVMAELHRKGVSTLHD